MINKQTTTRFAPSGVGGSSRIAESTTPTRRQDTGVEASIEIPAIWQGARETLRRRVGDARFDTWIARLELIAEVNGEILIAAPGELEYDRVNREFIRDIQHAWSQADSRGRKVRLDVRGRIEPEVLALAQPALAQPASQPAPDVDAPALDAGDTGADEQQTLENFLVGESNRIAFGLARRLALGASVAANVVTIIGPHGVGKTHLLKGIEAALKAARGDGTVLYMSSEDFTVAFVEGVKRKDTSDLRTLVRRAKVVLLDDFQFICSKPGTLVEFFSHLRAIVQAGGVVVLACDQTPAVLDQLDDRMRDEIQGGVTVQMDLPERSLRREIVRTKAEAVSAADKEFALTDEWIDLLADRLPASGRALYGAVRNVYVGTILTGQPLSKAAVEKAIQLQLGGSPVRAPKIDTIKDVTAKAYGVSKQDLESSCRKRQFAQPRQYAMYLSRQLTKCSYPQIGRMFGDRDHTTVLFAYRKISSMVAKNEGMAEELRQLEQRILADPRNNR
ncbi:MAG TPA: DnaA/Hda family protein [Hyphomonadaceae bacterium]